MNAIIYHNPRCSKSRQALALLEDKGIELEIIEYLKTPPDRKTLEALLDQLGLHPQALIRKGEAIYKQLNLSDRAADANALIKAMLDNPILIERPIVLANNKAVIGRPPERVLEIV